jgi:hypothetical protein
MSSYCCVHPGHVSKLLKTFKRESEVKTSKEQGVRDMFPDSQHFEGVEGRVGISGRD